MKKVKLFSEGEIIPDNAVFIGIQKKAISSAGEFPIYRDFYLYEVPVEEKDTDQ